MELYDGNLFDLLNHALKAPPRSAPLRIVEKPAQRPAAEKAFTRVITLPKRLQRPGCRCGSCSTCLDDARWDRIFNEKFADPTYYKGRMPSHASPLARAGA